MPLSAGDKLGHFEVVGAIGQGGMGEVYKARDTRLDRTVAIKVLHELVASDPAFRERFEREARAVSSLNHPHICTLHDVGSEGGVDFLVMEHLEGETLAERLKNGRLPLEQALRYGIEIADALDDAHHHGVVHRDLKPGNVMLTSGGVKIFDFGLAKFDTSGPGAAEEDSALPTAAKPLTEKGTILGTFQYMAPEQLEGREADSRTDLFSFGAVLYEMVTGHKAFTGKSQASLITAIMGSEPPPMAKLTPMTPPQLEHIVGRCLAKDPESRWQTAKDVKMELEWIQEQPELSETAPPEVVTGGGRERLGWILGLLAAVVVTGLTVWNLTRSSDATLIRTAISLPLGFELDPRQDSRALAISPDGSRIVYGALGGGAGSRLFLRPLDQFDATPLPGTENAINPFFSPDGQWVAFFADGKLLKVSVEGGAPIEITDAPFGSFGADWADDESIVFDNAYARGGLMRVSSDGGDKEVFTTVDDSGNEVAHRQPRSLPDGRGVLLHIEDSADWRAAVRPAESGAIRALRGIPANATLVRYLPSGHLVYTRAGGLWAVAFDLETLESTGSPTIVLDDIYTNERNHSVAISKGGTLVYAVGESKVGGGFTLAWVDREGRVTPVAGEPGPYSAPVLSPDGSQLAVNLGDSAVSEAWIFDLVRGIPEPCRRAKRRYAIVDARRRSHHLFDRLRHLFA